MGAMTKVHHMLLIISAVLATAFSDCPEIRKLGNCAFEIRCSEKIFDASLPEECQGSSNYPAFVTLTISKANENFHDESDTEFLTSITSLKIHGSWPTTSLSVLEYTPRLENLNLVGSNVEHIYGSPFFHLNRLQIIDISWNRLRDIKELFQVERPSRMKKLFLAHNHIDAIPENTFSNFSSLQELDLSCNNISDLSEKSFQNLTALIKLKLNGNKIKHLNGAVNNLQKLKHLFLSGNYIQSIDVPSLKTIYELETFDISWNQMETLTPIVFNRHWIHFESNRICKIKVSGNQITYLRNATLSKRIAERYMGSALKTVDVLTELDLSQNMISDIEYDAFQAVVRLSILDLSHNKLIKFVVNPVDMQHVKYLNLSSNYIQKLYLDSFWRMNNLQNLDLSHNSLDNIPDTRNHNLKYVNMTFNEIKVLKNLRIRMFHPEGGVLDLSNNGLYKLNIPHGDGLRLHILLLNANNISDASLIDLNFQNELKSLDMSYNLITKLDADSLRLPVTLSYLDLTHNYIEMIAPASFHRVGHLVTLRLSHNNISNIEYGAFQGLASLKNLDLAFNQIHHLDSKVLMDLKSLTVLSLSFNGLFVLEYKSWLGHKFDLKVFLEGNNFTCEWLGNALNDFNNGYSKMRPTVSNFVVDPKKHSLEGIPCVHKESEFARLSSNVMADDRLLILTQRILDAVVDQNSFMRKVIWPRQQELERLIKT